MRHTAAVNDAVDDLAREGIAVYIAMQASGI